MSKNTTENIAFQTNLAKAQTLNSTVNSGNPEIQVQQVTSTFIKTQLKNAFLNLSGVNFAERSSDLGLPYLLNVDSIDFVNVQMSWDTIDINAKSVCANFKSNTNSQEYCFTMYLKGSSAMQHPQ